MSTEYYLADKTKKELHALGENPVWSILTKVEWRTEWSLFQALWNSRGAQISGDKRKWAFYWSLWAADHVWSITQGFAPFYNQPCIDWVVIHSDEFMSGLELLDPDNSWPTIWDSNIPGMELREWMHAIYGFGFYDVFEVMES